MLPRRILASCLAIVWVVACNREPEPVPSASAPAPSPDRGTEPDAAAPPAPDADAGTGTEASAAIPDAKPDEGQGTRVRIMASNLTSGNLQSYEQPSIRIFRGLVPDVVVIQEFKYPGGDLRPFVDLAFGAEFSFYVEPRTGGIPNGIISRYPILQSGVWADASTPDRAFAYARIDVPGPIDLWAVSIHLLTSNASSRTAEATQLAGYLKSTVPAGDYVVVGGDLNADSAGEQTLGILGAEVVVTAPFPSDQSKNQNTSAHRNKHYDWLLARANLDSREVPVEIGDARFEAGLVFDSRVYAPLSDVAPVLATDSDAAGMQHMPVVRDFLLSGP